LSAPAKVQASTKAVNLLANKGQRYSPSSCARSERAALRSPSLARL
jgi:hypothetical protein